MPGIILIESQLMFNHDYDQKSIELSITYVDHILC